MIRVTENIISSSGDLTYHSNSKYFTLNAFMCAKEKPFNVYILILLDYNDLRKKNDSSIYFHLD